MTPAPSVRVLADGGPTTAAGYEAGAAACGLKRGGGLDLAIVASDRDAAAAGVFTQNQVAAAPVWVDRQTLAAGADRVRAVVVNAGNANAVTGDQGLRDARAMQALTAGAVGCRPGQVLVLSTGVIGVPLDMAKVERGIRDAASKLSPSNGAAAAQAIMTTDTREKRLAVELSLAGGRVRVGGMAKGAGMIHPKLATMLAVVTTDAMVDSDTLAGLLQQAVAVSFNCISIDGDTSTNDTVLLLANGASGVKLAVGTDDLARLAAAVTQVCTALAAAIVRDGEGATKFVTIQVTGAASAADAHRVAETIATSPLVKTALAGGDPNWGRVLAAAGRAGVGVAPERLALWVGQGSEPGLALVEGGMPLGYDESLASALFSGPEVALRLDLGVGAGAATVWTCDLTHDYITINGSYRT